MIKPKQTPFEQATDYLGNLKHELLHLSSSIKNSIQEIRLRVGRPISLQIKERTLCVSDKPITRADIEDCFLRICQYSVHSFGNELSQGFVTIKGGHRVGLSGTAVVKNNSITAIKDISGINIRIAKQILGSADEIMSRVFTNNLKSVIIAGEPISGKTTILRDLARQLGERHKVCIIDERSEIGAVYNGEPQLDIGTYTDVLNAFPKDKGIIIALRALSPDIIICDEIGNETSGLIDCMNSGVKVIVTAHSSSFDELFSRNSTKALISTGAFEKAILLGSGKNLGKVSGIWSLSRSGITNDNEIDWSNYSDGNGLAYGLEAFS